MTRCKVGAVFIRRVLQEFSMLMIGSLFTLSRLAEEGQFCLLHGMLPRRFTPDANEVHLLGCI